MTVKDKAWMGGLALGAFWIWARDTSWTQQWTGTLPILLSLLWFTWLVTPWSFRQDSPPISIGVATIGTLSLLIGVLTNTTLLLALSWALALKLWIDARCEEATRIKANRLIILPIMAFPWMALDGEVLSTFFRLTAAASADWLYSQLGFVVERSGTNPEIQGLPVTVNEACSGLGVLQAVMIAGVVLMEALIKNNNRFWTQVPLLIVVAWLADALRVVVLAFAALTWGPAFAAGPFHTWGGTGVLVAVFAGAWILIEFQQRSPKPKHP